MMAMVIPLWVGLYIHSAEWCIAAAIIFALGFVIFFASSFDDYLNSQHPENSKKIKHTSAAKIKGVTNQTKVNVQPGEDIIVQHRNKSGKFVKRSK